MTGSIGYCALTADILHTGHIKFISVCKQYCEHLIVGVMTDKCVKKYKGQYPILDYTERAAIVNALRDVREVIPQSTFDFNVKELREKHYVDIIIDSAEHQRKGANIYLPYDTSISSTAIKDKIKKTYKPKKGGR